MGAIIPMIRFSVLRPLLFMNTVMRLSCVQFIVVLFLKYRIVLDLDEKFHFLNLEGFFLLKIAEVFLLKIFVTFALIIL